MHSQLRERIRLLRARLDNAAPVAEIRAESQLFVTPAPVCDRLVTLAEISNRDHILEPSAGTGAILRAIRDTAPEAMCDAVESNSGLVRYLRENFNGVRVQCGDFMEWQPVQYYSRIIMNPPFSHGQDIRAAGSDERRELTHAVMRELDAPDNWTMNGEYGSEFGGFFPVQVRFTPAHERFHLALCSPGDVSQVWVLVLVNAGGEPFAVVQVQRRFAPEAVSHSLALAASLDAQGYSVNDIIHILMAEGGLV